MDREASGSGEVSEANGDGSTQIVARRRQKSKPLDRSLRIGTSSCD
jgi:hypothetical protein